MKRPFGRSSALWGGALLLTLLAACSTMNEALLPAVLTGPEGPVELNAEVGGAATGSFDFSSDERTRYRVSDDASWLVITSGGQGNIKPNQSKTVTFEATCAEVGSPSPATVTVTARSGDTTMVGVSLTCTDPGGPGDPGDPGDPPASDFTIKLIFPASFNDADQRQVFENAATRWSEIITGDVPSVAVDKPANYCIENEPAVDEVVNDIAIYASITAIDGPGGILGRAGPCLVRSGSLLPVYGIMEFDSDDIASLGAAFEDVILHEMGHVIGIGTIWEDLGLLDYRGPSCQLGRNIRFNGAGAVAEWRDLGGNRNVPVEDGGGAGTKCGHWKESVFDNELMTGYLNGSTNNPISSMTVASLGDLGYTVNLAAADLYDLPSGGNLQAQGARVEFHAVTLTPIGVVSEDGALLGAD